MAPTSDEKRTKLETMLGGFQSVVRVGIALKAPGVQYPEWWSDLDFNAINISYQYPGVGIHIDDEGIIISGLKTKGVVYGVTAPWSAIVLIQRPDGSEREQWTLNPSEFVKPFRELESKYSPYLLEIPYGHMSREAAIKAVHMLMLQLSECEEDSTAQFVLAKPPKSAYTGLKLVVNNSAKSKPMFKPLDPPPLNVA